MDEYTLSSEAVASVSTQPFPGDMPVMIVKQGTNIHNINNFAFKYMKVSYRSWCTQNLYGLLLLCLYNFLFLVDLTT